ncbi:MAG TPA: GTP 3',8-cyclase MoaA, partial [Acidimicrobiales bacterium]|nr:GTP 3',8-cyclase MoaA [Acidimicrobiales bacterium]
PRPATLDPVRVARSMPVTGPLVDTFGRVHDDLRISVTDRCNLRCVYCMPEEGVVWVPRSEILTFEEIERVATVAHELGVDCVRLTGGEPLVRASVTDLVARLGRIGFDDLSMTTNGTGLARMAPALVAAGLKRVNVSCDSLKPDRFAEIRRRGVLSTVLEAMDAVERAGLPPVKVNVVVMAGVNDDEVVDFATFARETGRVVRFIEFMPLDAGGAWQRSQVVPGEEILARINAVWPLEPASQRAVDAAPADRYRFVDGGGEIGVITSVTQAFCGTCNRLRITADGAIRNCLFANEEHPVRDALRSGADDAELALLLRSAVWAKRAGHGINDPSFLRPARSMSMIGG